MKHKLSVQAMTQLIDSEYMCIHQQGKIHFPEPDEMIYKFEGTLSIEALTKPMSLSVENFLLRGSSLRNTDFIYGIVTYTGHETKIMKNSANS